ncbi:hypothetical protein [Nocardia sp. NBC_00508]|uniref:hypothetical protein n=1 Tax=Nocardia sp. NBC_00508 TaxID=2975992 RepID=UPI002E80FD9A|nr:hypothetical protein [Nocardia sp. NBC_00508]
MGQRAVHVREARPAHTRQHSQLLHRTHYSMVRFMMQLTPWTLVFPTLGAPVAVPTVAQSMYLHGDPAGRRPVLVRATNASTGGGWSVDDIAIRNRGGQLLASARQTRRVLG